MVVRELKYCTSVSTNIYSISCRKKRVGATSRFTGLNDWIFPFPLPGQGRNCQLRIRSSSIQVPGEGGAIVHGTRISSFFKLKISGLRVVNFKNNLVNRPTTCRTFKVLLKKAAGLYQM